MPQNPLVSIVVNNYNQAPYLRECMESLISQTYRNIEIIAVDAFSSDDSREILEEYAARDSRVKLVYCTQYEPFPAITYNLGFLNTTGDFIAIADPDDISLSRRIELQVEFLLANPDVGVCGTNCREFNKNQDILVETTVEKNVRNAAPPARNPTLMLRKECLAKFGMWNWKCEYAADFEWLYRFYCGGVKFHILKECCLMYRYSHGSNVSTHKRLNQTLKLAKFRTIFGIRLFNQVGLNWWKMTISTYLYSVKQLVCLVPKLFILSTRRA